MATSKQAPTVTLSAGDLMNRLRVRYSPPSFAFLPQVANGTGSHKSRTADALAMSLWPSRGLELHGFEIKVSRTDWLRELKEPAKADAIGRYCDRWWIVVPAKEIVKPGELPKGWGLLVSRGMGLASVIEASLIETEPVSRTFLAAVLRVAAGPGQAEVAAASEAGYRLGLEAGEKSADRSRESGAREEAVARKAIVDFELASGIKISEWSAGRVGARFKLVMETSPDRLLQPLVDIQRQAKRVYEGITRELEKAEAE